MMGDGGDPLNPLLGNHRVVRDGSLWSCVHCRCTWPFPAPVPRDAGPCIPRRWGDDLKETT